MERIIRVVRNKYLIAIAVFLVWMTFFERYDFATQYHYQQEKNKLEGEKAFYTSEIATIGAAIKDIKSNPDIVQKIAREKYKMKRPVEDVYIIVDGSDTEKK